MLFNKDIIIPKDYLKSKGKKGFWSKETDNSINIITFYLNKELNELINKIYK